MFHPSQINTQKKRGTRILDYHPPPPPKPQHAEPPSIKKQKKENCESSQ
eukprot:gene9365-6585_t